MIRTLSHALELLPAWLTDLDGWRSLDVDYHPPRVERLYRPLGEGRLYLHRVHPCAADEALLHPHPWPCAIQVLEGTYEMGIAYGSGETPPPLAARLVATPPLTYEMLEPDAWHYVRPVAQPSLSLMVTGAPWRRWSPRPSDALRTLPVGAARDLLAAFREALGR